MDLHGIVPPMVTPAAAREGGVNVEALREYTDFLVEGGVHGLFPNASLGEFTSLTREERRTVVETVVERSGGRPVMAGCGGTALADVEAYIGDAADAGADAAVVVTPYYLDTTQDGLRAFYETLADRSALPVVLYNIPQLTGHALSVETVVALAEHDAVVGVKDSSGDAGYHYRLASETPDGFAVFQGIPALAVAALDSGAAGLVNGPANVFPGAFADLYEAHRADDRDRAVEVLNRVANPVASAFAPMPTAPALKYLVGLAGHDVGPPLVPLPTLTDEQKRALRERYETVSESLAAHAEP